MWTVAINRHSDTYCGVWLWGSDRQHLWSCVRDRWVLNHLRETHTYGDRDKDTNRDTYVCMYVSIRRVKHLLLCVSYLLLRGRALKLSLAPNWLLTVWRVVHSRGTIRVQERLPWEVKRLIKTNVCLCVVCAVLLCMCLYVFCTSMWVH